MKIIARKCSCGKFGYSSKAKARKIMLRKRNYPGKAKEVYRCPVSGAWHLTSHRITDYPEAIQRRFRALNKAGATTS